MRSISALCCTGCILVAVAKADAEPGGSPPASSVGQATVEQLCQRYADGFIFPGTELAYGKRINGPRGLAVLESPEQIALRQVNGQYRPFGYGSGIEDLAYHNGMLLFALCDAEQATGSALFANMARQAFRGLQRMSTLSKVEGFVPRGPHPDGKSYYPDSSLDQHSLYLCGLWRYARSRLATPDEKTWIARTASKVLARLEKDQWSFQVEDGSKASHAGGSMLRFEPVGAALALSMLAIANDLTGDQRWKEAYDRFGSEQEGRRWQLLARRIDRKHDAKPPQWNLFYNQDALRIETLRRIETSAQRQAILRGRLANMASDMLTTPYFRVFRRLDWIGDEETQGVAADAAANAYLAPLGITVDSPATIMQLWHDHNTSQVPPGRIGKRQNHFEPILLATPAMVWQIALLSDDPQLLATVRPAVAEMLHRTDFDKVHLGWAYNYAVLAALWDLAKSP